jgi:hypothetical protein
VAFASLDGTAHAAVNAAVVSDLPHGSVFTSLAEASAFFEEAPLGYSATHRPGHLEAIELHCDGWRVEPALVHRAESNFFEDPALFPAGAAELDSALIMLDIPAVWKPRAEMATAKAGARPQRLVRDAGAGHSDPGQADDLLCPRPMISPSGNNDGLVPAVGEGRDQVATDESGSARDGYAHGRLLMAKDEWSQARRARLR